MWYPISNLNLLEDRRNSHLSNLMYVKSRDTEYQDKRLLNTRKYDGPVLPIPTFIKTKPQNAAWYRGASAWNLFDPEMRTVDTYTKFKFKQKCLMKNLLLYCDILDMHIAHLVKSHKIWHLLYIVIFTWTMHRNDHIIFHLPMHCVLFTRIAF